MEDMMKRLVEARSKAGLTAKELVIDLAVELAVLCYEVEEQQERNLDLVRNYGQLQEKNATQSELLTKVRDELSQWQDKTEELNQQNIELNQKLSYLSHDIKVVESESKRLHAANEAQCLEIEQLRNLIRAMDHKEPYTNEQETLLQNLRECFFTRAGSERRLE